MVLVHDIIGYKRRYLCVELRQRIENIATPTNNILGISLTVTTAHLSHTRIRIIPIQNI